MRPRPGGPKPPSPPAHLRDDGRKLWRTIVGEYNLGPDALAMLALACSALDRCEDARRHIDEHGPSYTLKSGAIKARPETVIERDARSAVGRLMKMLGLDLEPINAKPGRPAGR